MGTENKNARGVIDQTCGFPRRFKLPSERISIIDLSQGRQEVPVRSVVCGQLTRVKGRGICNASGEKRIGCIQLANLRRESAAHASEQQVPVVAWQDPIVEAREVFPNPEPEVSQSRKKMSEEQAGKILKKDISEIERTIVSAALVTKKDHPGNPELLFPDRRGAQQERFARYVVGQLNLNNSALKNMRRKKEVEAAVDRVQGMLRAGSDYPDLMPKVLKTFLDGISSLGKVYHNVDPADLALVLTGEKDWETFVHERKIEINSQRQNS